MMSCNLRSPIPVLLVLQWTTMGLVSATNISTEEKGTLQMPISLSTVARTLSLFIRNDASVSATLSQQQDSGEAGLATAEVIDLSVTEASITVIDQQRQSDVLGVSDGSMPAQHHVRGRRAVVIRGPFYPYPAARKSGASTLSTLSTCCLLTFAVKLL
ncbi:unnamed protein product [Meganyctiphanes norvegica]|uniref:Uncharacterized protein n=1 Tax=Meganyctiphanes norvegica TaxID=48144 RepID=A0AAV2RV37_MEGNR